MKMSLKHEPVPMPDKKITFKKATNGTIYVYYTVRAYRNKNGAPTSEEVAIGKKDANGDLIPNRRYYEIYQDVSVSTTAINQPTPKSVQSRGSTVALMETAKQTGVLEILKNCFPDRWGQILAGAFYMLCEGNVMMYIEDWFDETEINFTRRMDDVAYSKLFASISYEDRKLFFNEWVRYRREKEYIAYDVSSISTYSRSIDSAEWGYNRDNEKLPQLNLGMYYGVTSHIPVYYDLYSGSIPDKTYMEFMMTKAKDIGIRDVCYVMDRGFVTEDNVKYMYGNDVDFITAMPGARLEALRLIDECKGEIRKTANRIGEYEVYGISRSIELYGSRVQAHIYYDPEKQALDEKELYGHVDKLQAELEKMSRSRRLTKRYTDYFMINEKSKDIFDYEVNGDKVDEKLSRAGFFILLSSKPELSSHDVLKIYRTRDVIEKHFDQFKNRMDFKRMRTHWNKSMEGKMFVGFIALVLRSALLCKVKNDAQIKNLTLEKVLLELKKIKAVTLTDLSKIIIPLTKIQKTILSSLGILRYLLFT
jgi:transposase